MGKKVILIPLTKKNTEGMRQQKNKGQLFITVSGKKLLREREQDLLGLVVADKSEEKEHEIIGPKLKRLFAEFPHLKEPQRLPPLNDI